MSKRVKKNETITITRANLNALQSRIDSYYKNKYRGFNAASVNRLSNDRVITAESSYDEIKASLKILIGRSRDAFNNNPYAKAIVNIFYSNIVCEGIKPTPRVKNSKGESATKINDSIKNLWDRFNDISDITGKCTFYENQKTSLGTTILTGGSFTNCVVDPKFKYIPIRLQYFGQDMLDFTKDHSYHTGWKRATMCGIALNQYMQPQYYNFGDTFTSQKINAENVIHTYMRAHPDQVTGIPWMVATLLGLHDIETIIEDAAVASKIRSSIAFWKKKNTDDLVPGEENLSEDEENLIIEPGAVWVTKEKPEAIQASDEISKVIEPLIKIILHGTAVSQGFSYGLLTRDLNNSNFSASRANTSEDRRYFSTLIKWFYKDHCQKIYEKFVYYCALSGLIDGLSFSEYSRDPWLYNQCSWSTNAWEYINPLQDVQASIALKNAGLLTDEQFFAEIGKNYTDVYKQLAKEKGEKEALNILTTMTTTGVQNA